MLKGIYIVTGATGAIGQAIVEEVLSNEKTTVILACRNTEKAGEITEGKGYGDRIKIMELDLADLKSVESFAGKVKASGVRIAGIFNNAGVMPGKMRVTADGPEYATQVNFIATAILTELLLPMIEPGGGIVFTTSMTRRIARLHNNWDELSKKSHQRFVTYGRSKLMLTHYAYELSRRVAGRVRVNCSDPWIVNSGMIKMGNRTVDKLSGRIGPKIFRSPQQGALPALQAMESEATGQIFTLRAHSPISGRYERAQYHALPQKIIKEWLEKIGGCVKKS